MINNACIILKNIIDDIKQQKKIKNEYKLNPNDLIEYGYRSFANALGKKGLFIEDVCEKTKIPLLNMIDIIKSDFQSKTSYLWNLYIGSKSFINSLINVKDKSDYINRMLENARKLHEDIRKDIIQKKKENNEIIDEGYILTNIELKKYKYKTVYNSFKFRGISIKNGRLIISDKDLQKKSQDLDLNTLKLKDPIMWNEIIGSIKYLNTLTDVKNKEAYNERKLKISVIVLKEIIDDIKQQKKVKGEYKLNPNDLIKYGYESFTTALTERGVFFEDVVKETGIPLEKIIKLYKSGERIPWKYYIGSNKHLNSLINTKNKEIYKKKMLENSAKIYEQILDEINQQNKIDGDFFLRSEELEDFGYYQMFRDALRNLAISVNDIRKYLDHPKIEYGYSGRIGTKIHEFLEKKFNFIMRNKNCLSFSEVKPNIKSDVEEYMNTRIDNLLIIDENCKKISNKLSRFLNSHPKIRIINIDYFMTNSDYYIRKHCLRGYQNPNRLLILIPLYSKSIQIPPLNIPYGNNVKILGIHSFTDLFGYSDEDKLKVIQNIKLAKDAIWKDNRELILEKLDNSIENMRNTQILYSQKEFNEYVTKNNLDEFLFTEGPLDKYVKKNNTLHRKS